MLICIHVLIKHTTHLHFTFETINSQCSIWNVTNCERQYPVYYGLNWIGHMVVNWRALFIDGLSKIVYLGTVGYWYMQACCVLWLVNPESTGVVIIPGLVIQVEQCLSTSLEYCDSIIFIKEWVYSLWFCKKCFNRTDERLITLYTISIVEYLLDIEDYHLLFIYFSIDRY